MKNMLFLKLKGTVKLRISGRNINQFLGRLIKSKIELLNVRNIKYNEIIILIYEKDYKKIKEIKSIYDISLVDTYGIIKMKKMLKVNQTFIFPFILGLIMLVILANIIFEVEIIHLNKDIRNVVSSELEKRNIKKFRFKKSYNQLQKIKNEIILEYKDKIEWIEIEEIGTKYIIRIEERKVDSKEEVIPKRHIVATKNAIIKKVEAKTGEIIKSVNDYVNPGDIIISGEIKLYDDVKNTVGAEGRVFGETWYQVIVEYPLAQKVETLTGKKKKVLAFKFLNKKIDFFNFNPFKNKKSNDFLLIGSSLLPIGLVIDEQEELEVYEEVNTIDTAINKAMEIGKKRMLEKLDEFEYIIKQNSLKVDIKSSKIVLEIFFAIYEDITSYQEIVEEPIIVE